MHSTASSGAAPAATASDLLSAILNACKVATHIRPDPDATMATWLVQRVRRQHNLPPVEVLFIPQNTDGVEDGILAVDIGEGLGLQMFGDGWSIKHSSDGGSAAAAILPLLDPEERDILDAVVQAISQADVTGENVHTRVLKQSGLWDDVKTRNMVLSTTLWAIHASISHVAGDREIYRIFSTIYDGEIAKGKSRRKGEKAAQQAQYLFGGKLAILPHGAPPSASPHAYQRGARVVLFSSDLGGDRFTLGLVRNPNLPEVDLTALKPLLVEWFPDIFVHPDGFMIGWTAKAPLQLPIEEFDVWRDLFIKKVTEKLEELFPQ